MVRPLFLGNIGSAARVLKNFGFDTLRLVAPPKNYKEAEARRMAVGAFDLLKTCSVYSDLSTALSDIDISVGTSSKRQRACLTTILSDLSPFLTANSNQKIAIIFGEERDGLTTEDLSLCQYIVSIPTVPTFPSLNISQALGIFAYELSRTSGAAPGALSELAGADATADFLEELTGLLQDARFLRNYNKKSVMSEFRALLQKAMPSERELRLLHGALRKVQRKILTPEPDKNSPAAEENTPDKNNSD